jgi:hypothetical protein
LFSFHLRSKITCSDYYAFNSYLIIKESCVVVRGRGKEAILVRHK